VLTSEASGARRSISTSSGKRQARWPPRQTAGQVRTGDQSQDRRGSGPGNPEALMSRE